MSTKATRGMYDSDGSGREFLSCDTEEEIVQRLAERGIDEENSDPAVYEEEFERELERLIQAAEDDYGEMLADRYESAQEAREYWANRPGGEADYMY